MRLINKITLLSYLYIYNSIKTATNSTTSLSAWWIFLSLCKYLLQKQKENKREAPFLSQRCNFPQWWCGAHAFMVSVAEVEGNLQYLQPHFSDHSSLRGSLVTVQKNFIYFQACSCLSEPPGLDWRTGGRGGIHSLSTAGCRQPPTLLLLGIPEISEVPSAPPPPPRKLDW